MKGIFPKNMKLFTAFFIIIILSFLFGCDGVTPSGPVINSFTAGSTSITEGESVTLNWVTTGATTVYLGQESESSGSTGTVDPTGSKTVSPSETTTYTITATSSSGSDSSSITITVTEDTTGFPTIESFTASATSITEGDSITLTWVTTGATTVSLEHSSLSSAGGEAVALSDSTTVSPDEDTDYILTAINSAGSVTETVTVTMKLPVWNYYTEVYYPTIQAAIDDAVLDPRIGAVIIKVLPGIYYENIVFRDDFYIAVAADGDDPADFIIDGRGLDSVVTINGGHGWLEGLTIQYGRDDYGGGIHIINGYGKIKDCIIRDNEAVVSGGGIYMSDSGLSINDSTIRDNAANSYGGGMYIESSSVAIRDSLISANGTGLKGGGIYIRSISGSNEVTIQSNTIRENRANTSEDEAGGGMYLDDDSVDPFLVEIGASNTFVYEWYNTICSNVPDQGKPDRFFGSNFANFNDIYTVCR